MRNPQVNNSVLNRSRLWDASYQHKKEEWVFYGNNGVVWHFTCLDTGQLHIGMPCGICPALRGCGHSSSIRNHSGNMSVYNHWSCHPSPDKLTSSLKLAGFSMRWSLGIIMRSGVEVKTLTWVTFDCPIWECHISDGDINYGPLPGARSRRLQMESTVVKNPSAIMATLWGPNNDALVSYQICYPLWVWLWDFGYVSAEAWIQSTISRISRTLLCDPVGDHPYLNESNLDEVQPSPQITLAWIALLFSRGRWNTIADQNWWVQFYVSTELLSLNCQH